MLNYEFENCVEENSDCTFWGFDEPLEESNLEETIAEEEFVFSDKCILDYDDLDEIFCYNKKKSKKKKSKKSKSKKKNKKTSSKKKLLKNNSKSKNDKKVLSNGAELKNSIRELRNEVANLKQNLQENLEYTHQIETKMLWTLVSILKPETTKLIPDTMPVYQISKK